MEPQHLIRTIRRRWRPIVALAVLGAALGFASSAVASDAAPPPVPVTRYEACHSLLVDTTIPNNVEQWDVRNLAQLAQRITQGAIPETVAASVGMPVAELSPRVRVVVRNDIQSVTICAVGETPTEVEDVADGTASALVGFLEAEAVDFQNERLESAASRVEDAQARRDEAEAAIAALVEADEDADTLGPAQQAAAARLELAQANSELVTYESSGVPVVPLETLESADASTISERTFDSRVRAGAAGANVIVGIGDSVGTTGDPVTADSASPIPDTPTTRGAFGAALGAAMGFGFVMFTERLDSRLRRKEDVETTLDLPVLAEIPPLSRDMRNSARIIAMEEPRSRSAESFRALRSALDYARMVDEEQGRSPGGAQVVLVTSAGPSEGKTTTLANLAAVMAEGERRVLAVNCDFRRPRLHRYLGGMAAPQKLNATDVPGVQLVTQVTRADNDATPSDVVEAQRRLVTRARDRFDVILLDTAPVLTTNDASELLSVVDHVVLVVAAGQTDADSAARATELLERRGCPPLGVALAGARDVPNSAEYYYDDDDPYLEPTSRRRRRSTSEDGGAVIDLASRTEVTAGG